MRFFSRAGVVVAGRLSLERGGGEGSTSCAGHAVAPAVAGALGLLFALALLLPARALLAQAPPEPSDAPAPVPAAPAMTAPQLTHFVEAVYPPEAEAQGLEAKVELELVLGPDGLVKEARVVTPVGHGFDEAALAAARQFLFAPATRAGQAIGARIRYSYVFELREQTPPPPEPEAPPPPGRLDGQILDAEKGEPIVGAEVVVTRPGLPAPLRALTDGGGRFAFDGLEAGDYNVRVTAEKRITREQDEQVAAGEVTSITYRMAEPVDDQAFSAVARIPPPPREVTRRTIGKEALTRMAGTRGDALRTIELLPGVARPPLGSGVLIVRGSAPGDTQALFEGVPVPLLYHFGGLTSFINSRMIESIEFYPGNFSVRYGRIRGGVVEVRAADLKHEWSGVADINLIDVSLLAQAPIGEDAEVALAYRRSYIGALLAEVLEDEDLSTVAAPVYYDYQAMAQWRPSDTDKLRFMIFGSSDELQLLFEEPSDSDAAFTGDLDLGTQFHRGQAAWRKKLSDKVDQDVDLSVGIVDVDFGLGEAFKFNLDGIDIYARTEWRGRVTEKVRLIGGLDLFFLPGQYTYVGPPPGDTENNPDANVNGATLSNRDEIRVTDDFVVVQPAVYLETDLNLQPWRFVIGSRVDYYEEIDKFSYDPRGSGFYTLTDTTTLKGGIGLFSQAPQFQESSPGLGNPNLDPTQTLHVGAGFDQEVTENFSFGIEGFYKHMYDRVVGTELGGPPFFVNDGEGRAYGMEVALKLLPPGRVFGYLSYTLSRSERRDHDEDWVLFDFDQTHILTVSAVSRLGRGWELGATFRFYSGNLDTPVIGSFYNAGTGQYSAVFGATNSTRNPNFNRLDLRIEKQWTFSAWKLALYLDLQNAYNAENPEGEVCSFDFEECEEIRGLPIIPNLGLRGEI